MQRSDESPRPVRLIGLPFDETSSFRRGAAAAPGAIRERLASSAGNRTTEDGVELAAERLEIGGDLAPADGDRRDAAIRRAVVGLLDDGRRPLLLGGDHWVSAPILEALASRVEGLTVVQLDAHPDLYDRFEGSRVSHACPFARVMERGTVTRLVQIGIRAGNAHQARQAERFGVETITASDWARGERPSVEGPLYLSVDLDGFDPAFAPAVAHQEPGGLVPRDVFDWIRTLDGLAGADVVELQPDLDRDGVTTALAAKLVKEIAGRLFVAGGPA